MNLFGKPKERGISAANSQATAEATVKRVQDNAAQIMLLEKREQVLMARIEQCNNAARNKVAKKDKNGALFEMKRKKTYEGEINKLSSMRLVLEQMNMSLESAATNASFFVAIDGGNRQLKQVQQASGIDEDKAAKIMEDFEDAKQANEDVMNAITSPMGDLADDDELNDMLRELEESDMAAAQTSKAPAPAAAVAQNNVYNFPSTQQVNSFPSAPVSSRPAAVQQESEEDRQLRELSASLGI